MSSPKLISLFLIATFAIQASVNQVSAAQVSEIPVFNEAAQQVSIPDEARILSDLKSHYLFVNSPVLGTWPGANNQADATAIRTSVRKGETIEFRVTSVYYADPSGGPQREVDSIVSYQKDGGHWELLGVQIEGSRNVTAGNPGKADESC